MAQGEAGHPPVPCEGEQQVRPDVHDGDPDVDDGRRSGVAHRVQGSRHQLEGREERQTDREPREGAREDRQLHAAHGPVAREQRDDRSGEDDVAGRRRDHHDHRVAGSSGEQVADARPILARPSFGHAGDQRREDGDRDDRMREREEHERL